MPLRWPLAPSCRKHKTEKNGRSHTQVGSLTQRNKIIVSEQEMLALVWTTRYFRCYLYAKRFLVRTDHAALTYLQKFADHNSRLLRWSLKLSELDFVVEHRAGSKIGHVDALSRHVGAITNPDPLSRESVQQEQRKDFLSHTKQRDLPQ